jgi:hypothetical protein
MTRKISSVWLVSFIVLAIVALVYVILPHSVFAQTPDAPSKDLANLQLTIFSGGFFDAFGKILSFLLLLAGIVAFLFVLYGGFLYLTAGGDAARAETGRKYITNAIIGIILIFISYSVVRFIVGRTTVNSNQKLDVTR